MDDLPYEDAVITLLNGCLVVLSKLLKIIVCSGFDAYMLIWLRMFDLA